MRPLLPVPALVCALVCALPAAAALPGGTAPVNIVAREQPIASFLRDLFAQSGQTLVIEGSMTGTVSGNFSDTADSVFAGIAKAFGLIASFDGTAVHVWPAAAQTSRLVRVATGDASAILAEARALGILTTGNRVQLTRSGLIASGTPGFVGQIAELAGDSSGRLRAAPAFRPVGGIAAPRPLEFRVFPLRYASADDSNVYAAGRETRVPGLASLLRSLVTDQPLQQGTAPANNFGARRVRQSANRLGGGGLANLPPELAQLPVLGLDSDTAADRTAAAPAAVMVPVSAGAIRIEANPAMNAVIVRDSADRMPSYERLIQALDVEPRLVEVEVTIVDVNIQKLRQLGVNFRIGSGGFGALFGDGTPNDLRLLPGGSTLRGNVENITPSARGGVISTIIGSQREFIARVSALEERGAARIVSRPQVMTLSNVEAVFDRSRTFFVRVQGSLNVDLFNVTAGTILRVNPHAFRDGSQDRIRMLVNIEDGTLLPGPGVDGIPIIERSTVSTQALIANGESLLLGGLTVDSDIENITKVPLLGDIPLLGELFRQRSRSKQRLERLFLITPRLAGSDARQRAAQAVRDAAQPAIAPAVQPAVQPASLPSAPAKPSGGNR
jgi:type III secretion protein C